MEENIRELIQRELPSLVMNDPQIRGDWVWHLIHDFAPNRAETESRFEQIWQNSTQCAKNSKMKRALCAKKANANGRNTNVDGKKTPANGRKTNVDGKKIKKSFVN